MEVAGILIVVVVLGAVFSKFFDNWTKINNTYWFLEKRDNDKSTNDKKN